MSEEILSACKSDPERHIMDAYSHTLYKQWQWKWSEIET